MSARSNGSFLKPFITMTFTTTITAASLALGASVISLAAPAARADVYDSFGIYGNCDSGAVSIRKVNGASVKAGGRDCRDARRWASKEASRNRSHNTQTQLIGLGGNLVTGLIFNAQQQRQQQPAPAPAAHAPSATELALIKQQHEIELLKLKLQLQAQQAQPAHGASTKVVYMPGYPQPPMTKPAFGGHAAAPVLIR